MKTEVAGRGRSQELRELARPRRLVTGELSPFNAFYGHADLLRAYAGIDGRRSLKASVEHGATFFPYAADPDLARWLPRYFCASPFQARFFEEHAQHGAKATALGSLILYACSLEPPKGATTRRLVYFDAHSSDYATATYDEDAAVARLDAFRGEFEEVVVCLYWRDVLLGRADIYLARGYECVTAGHMFDPRFLFRLAEIISSATVVFTDRLGTHVLYALALDRPVWLEYAAARYELAPNAPHGPIEDGEPRLIERMIELFRPRVETVQPEQRAFSDEMNGTACLRSPSEVAALIAEAEVAYRTEIPRRRRLELEAVATARRLWNLRPW